MYSNPFVAQLVAKETIEDAIRRVDQVRPVRAVEGVRKPRRWQLLALAAFKNMLTPVFRPQFKRRVKA